MRLTIGSGDDYRHDPRPCPIFYCSVFAFFRHIAHAHSVLDSSPTTHGVRWGILLHIVTGGIIRFPDDSHRKGAWQCPPQLVAPPGRVKAIAS